MSPSTDVAAIGGERVDRAARGAERLLRVAADARLALGLLLVAGVANAIAAALPGGPALLASPAYLVLLAAILCAGVASVAVRAPAAWREWRRPALFAEGTDVLVAEIALAHPLEAMGWDAVAGAVRREGYRVVERGTGRAATLAGTRRGWSRLVAQLSHIALVLMLLGAAGGRAFSSETTFSLLPGQQALLDSPRPGFTDAIRLDRFDARFGADGRPQRLDATVTFLRDGNPAATQLVQVNSPGTFDGYLLHGWTYGPAAKIRGVTLGGQVLVDASVALDKTIDGRPSAFVELPTVGLTLGLSLVDAAANEIAVTASTAAGALDTVRLRPGQKLRIGSVSVILIGFDAYLTFLSRRDPGMALLFGGAALLVACLAVALWLPRRRLTIRRGDGTLRLLLRGERFDRPEAELAALRRRVDDALRVAR
jgi:cytochrome c biogenesis protein ResB